MYKKNDLKVLFGISFLLIILLNSCGGPTDNSNDNKESMEQKPEQIVTGIGGIFFKCENPESTRNWYTSNLGFLTNEYGAMFETLSLENKISYLQWSPFSSKTKYFEPSEKSFMINYRVNNLKKLELELRNNGVTILDTIETYEYGSFLHILDSENNKIELWEPIDVVFTNLYSGTTNVKSTVNRIVFKAKDPNALSDWYHKNLGLILSEEGSYFEYKKNDNLESIRRLLWKPVSFDSDLFLVDNQELIIGYNIDNLEGNLFKLLQSGINIENTDKVEDGSKVANLIDIDNHQLMLFDSK